MTDRPWFRPRQSGLGWTPASWQGWLIVLASVAAALGANLLFLARIATRTH
jgi:hypothetical protein